MKLRPATFPVPDYFTWRTASDALVATGQWNLLRYGWGQRQPLAPELVGRIAALEVRWTDEPRGCWRADVAARCIELPPRAQHSVDDLREAVAHAVAHAIVALEDGDRRSHCDQWSRWARKLGGAGRARPKAERVVACCSRCGRDIRGRRAMTEYELSQPHRGCGGEMLRT